MHRWLRGHDLIFITLICCFGASNALAQLPDPSWQLKVFPRGKLFQPLIADPKQPMFRLGMAWVNSDVSETLMGIVATGETFGIFRLQQPGLNNGVQLDISGGVFAQFDLLGESSDLINADYVIGLPLTYRFNATSVRLRLYHQSSHLGDEYLLVNHPQRVNLSFEALELLISYDWHALRLYGGGEYLVRVDPDDLDHALVHLGWQYRHPQPLIHFKTDNICTLLFAMDTKLWQQDGYEPSLNMKGGIEIGTDDDLQQGNRTLRVLLEGFHGLAPYGQFFSQQVQLWSVGLEVQLSL